MCGTCAGICPQKAITMAWDYSKGVYTPHINDSLCNQCGLCVQCCPGFGMDISKYRAQKYSEVQIHPLFGAYNAIFRAYSSDVTIRQRGASGGVVTSILRYLFSQKLVDAAIVTKMDENDPINVVPIIAYNDEDLFVSQKSKYAPTALNTILEKCLSDKFQGKRLAYVGLPCHLAGLRLAQEKYTKLAERIPFTLSLFCHHMPTRRATEFLMYKNGVQLNKLKHIAFRGGGKPGRLQFLLRDNRKIFVPHLHWTYWGCAFLYFFIPARCWLCYDKMGEMADFSIGDNWQNYGDRDKKAATVVARSEEAKKILHDMCRKGHIEKSDMSVQELVRDQGLENVYNISSRLALWKWIGREIPDYRNLISSGKIRIREFMPAFRILICQNVASLPIMDIIIKIFYAQEIMLRPIRRFKRRLRKLYGLIIKR